MRTDQIICDICKGPVDRIVWFDDIETGAMVLQAICHGDMDEMKISAAQIMAMSNDEMEQLSSAQGVAFATKRVGHNVKLRGALQRAPLE